MRCFSQTKFLSFNISSQVVSDAGIGLFLVIQTQGDTFVTELNNSLTKSSVLNTTLYMYNKGRHIYCAWMNFNDYFIRYSSYMAALTNTTDPEQSWRVEQVSNSIYWNFVLHCNSILYNPDFCWNSRNIIRDQRNEVSAKQNLISVDNCWISGPSIVSHWKLTMRKTLQNSIWSQANSNPKVVLWIVANSLISDIKQL